QLMAEFRRERRLALRHLPRAHWGSDDLDRALGLRESGVKWAEIAAGGLEGAWVMDWLTGGEALVKSLAREGVRVVFGVPGVQLYGVLAALRDEPGMRFITTRHEQATGYMADGYARAGGEFGTALVVPGPGLLNASAGLSTAYSASSPVLMISGQVPKSGIGKDIGLLHEVNDQLDCITPITKWRRRVVEVEDVPGAVRDAVQQL